MKQRLKGNYLIVFITLFFLSLEENILAQQFEFLSSVNENFLGTNLSTSMGFRSKALAFYAGPKYHFNSLREDYSKKNVFYKRGYASSLKEHLGFETNFHYYLPYKTSNFTPFLFYTFQYSYLSNRSTFFIPVYSSPDLVLYEKEKVIFSPTSFYENVLGIGITCDLTNRIQLLLKSGIGIINYTNIDNRILSERYSFRMESKKNYSGMFLWSIGLRFKSKNPV
ncbi:MAG: hypothetical protein H0X62_09625, partial [Bacteroidetes bacterium]|nr:hypothetical protein [Bacteroidota bacterium]